MTLDEMRIATKRRVLRRVGGITHFVAHNSNYRICFLFDSLWESYYWKTAYLTKESGETVPVVFEGDFFDLPLLPPGRYTLGLTVGDEVASELFPFRICEAPQDKITEEVDAIAPSAYDRLTGMINSQVEDMVEALRQELQRAKESGEFDGEAGTTPHIGDNGNWWIGEEDTGVFSGGSSSGSSYKIGDGLILNEEENTLSAVVTPESFHEITNMEVQEIINDLID